MTIAALRDGPYATAVFDGVDDRFKRTATDLALALHGARNISLVQWVKTYAILAATQVTANLGNSSTSSGMNIYLETTASNPARPSVQSRSVNEATATVNATGASVLPKQWSLLANVTSFEVPKVEAWMNGILFGTHAGPTFTQPTFDAASATYSYQIGANGSALASPFYGEIGDSLIFPRALTPSEMQDLYAGIMPRDCLAWLIPDPANNRFTDLLGRYHSDTVGGAPTFFPGGPWS